MISLRSEQPADVQDIHAVHRLSFPSAGEACLVGALRAARRLTASIVAEEAGRVVGHVAFSPVTANGQTGGAGLGPIAVLPEWRRRGVGGRLVREGLRCCSLAGTAFVVVLGNPAYYGRFGFRPAREWQLEDEYGGGDAFQALELARGSIVAGARVQYAPEFAALGV
jgi:putative acetyltransferase